MLHFGRVQKNGGAAPSSYHGKHKVKTAVDHAALIDSALFDESNEIVDAAMWPTLLEPATFMDTHVTKEAIERALRLSSEAELKTAMPTVSSTLIPKGSIENCSSCYWQIKHCV